MARVLRVDQMRPDGDVLAVASDVLMGRGVVVMPTDSVYGIGCAALPNNPAHERVFAIKRRARSQTLPWLAGDGDVLETHAVGVPDWAFDLAARLWPGALTLVVRAGGAVPAEYVAADGTVALRVPDSPLVRGLARTVGPLAVTSANTHGAAAATSGASVEAAIAGAVDLVLDAGPAPLGVASTIVDAATDAPRILREGAIPAEEILPS